jgi:hypothetical protein
LVLSPVAGVQPQVLQAQELRVRPPQQRLDPLVIHDLCAVDFGLEDESCRIHEQVAFAALGLLPTVVAALLATHPGRLH